MTRKTTYRYRSAITGRYVSAAYAKQHPKETVREAVKACPVRSAR